MFTSKWFITFKNKIQGTSPPTKLEIFISLAVVFILNLQSIVANDLLFHIRLGDFFLTHGTLPTTDIFSHTMFGKPQILHSFGLDIILAGIYRLGGWGALVLFTATLKTLLVFVAWLTACRLGASNFLSLGLTIALALLATPQLYHPQLISFIFFELILYFGVSSTTEIKNRTLFACLIALVWPIFHPSFPIGIGMLTMFGVWETFASPQKNKLNGMVWFLGAVFVTFAIAWILPTFFKDIWDHATASAMMNHIGQWRPLFAVAQLNLSDLWVIINMALVLVLTFFFFVTQKKFQKKYFLVLLVGIGCSAAALKSVRFLPLMVFAIAPLFVAQVSAFIENKKPAWLISSAFGYIGCSMILFVSSPRFHPGFSLDTSNVPIEGARYITDHNLPGEMFNSYNFGSYLLFTFNGERKVFIDPRAAQLYPDAFLDQFVRAYEDFTLFENLVSQYHVGYTFLKNNSPLTRNLISYLNQHPDWERVYADSKCIVHKRKKLADLKKK